MVQDRIGRGHDRDRTGRSVAAWTASRPRRDGMGRTAVMGLDMIGRIGWVALRWSFRGRGPSGCGQDVSARHEVGS